jgi:hypothetical protein
MAGCDIDSPGAAAGDAGSALGSGAGGFGSGACGGSSFEAGEVAIPGEGGGAGRFSAGTMSGVEAALARCLSPCEATEFRPAERFFGAEAFAAAGAAAAFASGYVEGFGLGDFAGAAGTDLAL